MSQLNKTQLEQENQSNFPNNNNGFITPTLLRTFNTDMIDSLVDENTFNSYSQSLSGSIEALELWSASLEVTFVTQVELTATQSILQGNIDGKLFTSSFNTFSSSNSATFTNYSASTAAVIANIDAVNDTTFGQYTASTNAFTQSINSYTASNDTKVNALTAQTASYAKLTANTFTDIQTMTSDLIVSGTLNTKGDTKFGDSPARVQQFTGSVRIQGPLTASLPQGYAWVGDSNNKSSLVATSSFGGGGVGVGFPFSGSAQITGSLGVTGSFSITGSVDMNVVSTPITTATMSLDFSLGNYFTGSASGSFHISASNLRPGETGILKMNTAVAALPALVATASFSSNVRQISGSAYTVTSGSNQTDILTFVALDATNIFLVASKKFI